MKQQSAFFKKLLGFFLIIVTAFCLVACDDVENPNIEKTPAPSEEESIVMTIHGYDISKSEYTIMLYNAAVELKMEAEPEYEMTNEEYQEWFFNFYNIEIDGKMPFDIVRENVLMDLREYAYYMQEIQAAGMTMTAADRHDIETNVLISVGEEYDPENPDDYFVYTYGVTKKQYIDYLVNLALKDAYINDMAAKETVKQEEIADYLENYRAHYMVWTIQNIYLEATTEEEFTIKQVVGESLAQRVRNGESMTDLVKQYSEDGGESEGLFQVSKDEWSYPPSILDWVYVAQQNDIGVVTAEDGVYVLKCVAIELEEDATAEIQYVLGVEQVKEKVAAICQGQDYAPQFNESVYQAFTKLPGDLMLSDSAVG